MYYFWFSYNDSYIIIPTNIGMIFDNVVVLIIDNDIVIEWYISGISLELYNSAYITIIYYRIIMYIYWKYGDESWGYIMIAGCWYISSLLVFSDWELLWYSIITSGSLMLETQENQRPTLWWWYKSNIMVIMYNHELYLVVHPT